MDEGRGERVRRLPREETHEDEPTALRGDDGPVLRVRETLEDVELALSLNDGAAPARRGGAELGRCRAGGERGMRELFAERSSGLVATIGERQLPWLLPQGLTPPRVHAFP